MRSSCCRSAPLPQELVAQRNRQHAREMVVARPGKTDFRHSRTSTRLRKCAQRLNRHCNIGVLQAEKPLSSAALRKRLGHPQASSRNAS